MAAALLLVCAGCEKDTPPLRLDDLNGGEYVYVERMVLLERAKTAALLDRDVGAALLDSLASAWGDSSLQATLTGAPGGPVRAAAVSTLLRRVLSAEQDSLLVIPGQDRMHSPLPDPDPSPDPATPSS